MDIVWQNDNEANMGFINVAGGLRLGPTLLHRQLPLMGKRTKKSDLFRPWSRSSSVTSLLRAALTVEALQAFDVSVSSSWFGYWYVVRVAPLAKVALNHSLSIQGQLHLHC